MKRIKILLWGLGQEYNHSLNSLKYWEQQQSIEIIGVTDRIVPEMEKIDGWNIYAANDIYKLNMDYILVMSEKYFHEIFQDILLLGIERNMILSVKILTIPYFDWNKYTKIQKSDLSIICNNCVGGILYNTLRLECLSPCKNLAIPDESFLKMIQNLEYYMNCKPKLARWQMDPHSKKKFPVMNLDGVEIWFNHDTVFDEALEKWNRRKKKINYKNILLIMYSESDETAEKFLSIVNYCKKIVFVPEQSKIENKNCIKLKMFPDQKEFFEIVNSSASMGKNSYCYKILDMLIGDREYRFS